VFKKEKKNIYLFEIKQILMNNKSYIKSLYEKKKKKKKKKKKIIITTNTINYHVNNILSLSISFS